jgi:hypothetical protein
MPRVYASMSVVAVLLIAVVLATNPLGTANSSSQTDAAAPHPGCDTVTNAKVEVGTVHAVVCPASLPIPEDLRSLLLSAGLSEAEIGQLDPATTLPERMVHSSVSVSTASYWCAWGEECWAWGTMSYGYANHTWAGESLIGQVQEVAWYTTQCTDPAGCMFLSSWDPPWAWRGEWARVVSSASASWSFCWCGNNQQSYCGIEN